MILSPSPILQFFDGNGDPLVGGLLFTYEASTTTKQAAFTDATGNTALPNPIILNARGEVAASATGTSIGLWLDPTLAYKFVLSPPGDTDPPTNPIWTIDDVVSPQTAILAALAQYEATLGGVPIGTQVAFAGSVVPNGWLLEYGQAISRTTYALLFAIIGIAYGDGDSSTTFNLPDKRGRASIGADNMGGSPANRVTQAVSGILATTVGQAGGDQHAQTDTLDASTTIAIGDPGHKHALHAAGEPATNATGGRDSGDPVVKFPNPPTMDNATTGITASAVTTVTSQLTGTSQNMQPSEVDNWIIFAGVSS
jgi:microcystin-dependent protein